MKETYEVVTWTRPEPPENERDYTYLVEVSHRRIVHSTNSEEVWLMESEKFVGILDALDYIRHRAEMGGFRHFELKTIGKRVDRPLRAGDIAKYSVGAA